MTDVQEVISGLPTQKLRELEREAMDELKHWGVLGMKWGVRKDRRTGKKVGTPVEGTKKAKRSAPSVSPGKDAPKKTGTPQSRGTRKTASPGGESSVPTAGSGKRMSVKLSQQQKSKMGKQKLKPEDYSIDQLRSAAERMRLESDIKKMLDGPNKDQQMQTVINRIKLEAEYKKLTALPPTRKQQALKKTQETLKKVAEKQIEAGLNDIASHFRKQFLESRGIKSGNQKKGEEDKKPNQTPNPKSKSQPTPQPKKKKNK